MIADHVILFLHGMSAEFEYLSQLYLFRSVFKNICWVSLH